MEHYFLRIEGDLVYSTRDARFVTEEEAFPNHIDRLLLRDEDGNFILGDIAYLRLWVISRGYVLAECLMTKVDKIKVIQDEYNPIFVSLKDAKASAEMFDDSDLVVEIKAEYVANHSEMVAKIQELEEDE